MYKVSAPGSLMLFGEHAVLYKKLALSCAIDVRISVTLLPRTDDRIQIKSSLGTYVADRSQIEITPELRFVLTAIKNHSPSSGFELEIQTQFSHLFGLGSSAAATVATLAALLLWQQGAIDKERLFKESLHTVRTVQGMASGADVAASVFGGIISYQMEPLRIESLSSLFPLTVVYSGSKMATKEVIAKVRTSYEKKSALFDRLFDSMHDVSLQAKEAISTQNWKEVGELFNIQQGLMCALGVNSAPLSEIVYTLRNHPEILGSKISGSGLGDCVIGLGKVQSLQTTYPVLPLQMSENGVYSE